MEKRARGRMRRTRRGRWGGVDGYEGGDGERPEVGYIEVGGFEEESVEPACLLLSSGLASKQASYFHPSAFGLLCSDARSRVGAGFGPKQ